ncbi:MAG: monovalent cation/H(+) antiporter subunit G [Planctomycetota bacterium]
MIATVTHAIIDILAALCLLVGLAFTLIGAIGIVRMPDAYHRLHAASKPSTLGLLCLLLGALLHLGQFDGGTPVVIKSVIALIFAFVALPTGSHILAKAAYANRDPQYPGTLDEKAGGPAGRV